MKVWILRHGEAHQFARSDEARELTENGRHEVLTSAARLLGQPLQRILVSPYVRAQQTAELVRQALGYTEPVETVRWLTPDSSPRKVLDNLDAYAGENVLLVSHQPLVGTLIGLAVHGNVQQTESMHTASLAELECEFPLAGAMQLVSLEHVN